MIKTNSPFPDAFVSTKYISPITMNRIFTPKIMDATLIMSVGTNPVSAR
jgi:hypothetical protein